MARYIRRGGFSSVLVVDNDHEIDALMDQPGLALPFLPPEAQAHNVHRVGCVDETDIAIDLGEAHGIFR